MRFRRVIFLLAAMTIAADVRGQQTEILSLESAYQKALSNSPRFEDESLQGSIHELKLANLSTRFRPAIGVNSQVIYHSEVAEIPIELPGQEAPSVANDQYKVAATVEQLLYDGGLTSRQKSLESARLLYDQQTLEVDLYKIRSRVEDAYFSALMAEAQLRSVDVLAADLQAKLAEVEALVDEGVLTGSNADKIRAELLQVEQERARIASAARASRESLGTLMGEDIMDSSLEIPQYADVEPPGEIGGRPELQQFELAREVIGRQDALGEASRRPSISSFGEVAYGRAPGLNLFETDFKPFFSAGIRMRWKAWDWNQRSRDSEISQLQQEIVSNRESDFIQSIDVLLSSKSQEIDRLREVLQTDDEVIRLRQRILEDTESRLESGLATTTDFIRESNALESARLAKELHKLELAYALARYNTIRGAE